MLTEMSLAVNILKSNFKRLSFPYKLTHAVTYKCNSRCVNCGIWKKKPANELTAAEIGEFFSKSNGFNWIDVTGGEIFLRKDIHEIFDAILENCGRLYNLHYPTNGLLTGRIVELTEELAKRKPRKLIVTVSMDGPPDVHDGLRGVKGGWKKAVETYRALREINGVEAYLGMTLFGENVGKFKDTLSSVKEEIPGISPRDFHLNIAHASGHYYGNTDAIKNYPKDEIVKEIEAFRRLRGVGINPVTMLEQMYLGMIKKYLEKGKTPVVCRAASASCFLDPCGNVYPCSIWDNKLGNIRESDYDLGKIWNSPDFRETAKEIENFKCPNCWTPCEAYQSILGNMLNL